MRRPVIRIDAIQPDEMTGPDRAQAGLVVHQLDWGSPRPSAGSGYHIRPTRGRIAASLLGMSVERLGEDLGEPGRVTHVCCPLCDYAAVSKIGPRRVQPVS